MDNQGPNNYNYNNGPGNNGSGGNGNNGGNRPGGNGGRNNRGGQGIMAFILLTLVALFVYALISNSISHASTQEKSYSDFIKQLDKGNVKSVEFDSYEIDYTRIMTSHITQAVWLMMSLCRHSKKQRPQRARLLR